MRAGWSLAPAFDVNPDPGPQEQPVTSIGIAAGPRAARTEALLACARDFGPDLHAAEARLATVTAGVRKWHRITAISIHANEQDLITDFFEPD